MENKEATADNSCNFTEEEYKEMQRFYDLLPKGKVIPLKKDTPKQYSSQVSSTQKQDLSPYALAPIQDSSDNSAKNLNLSIYKKTDKQNCTIEKNAFTPKYGTS